MGAGVLLDRRGSFAARCEFPASGNGLHSGGDLGGGPARSADRLSGDILIRLVHPDLVVPGDGALHV
ncbi:MAG: hypothetical protein ACK56I_27075, partial [bacterium]